MGHELRGAVGKYEINMDEGVFQTLGQAYLSPPRLPPPRLLLPPLLQFLLKKSVSHNS